MRHSFQFGLLGLLIGLIGLPPSAQAFYSHLTTGDITPTGKFEGLAETQILTSNQTGINITGRIDYGLGDSSTLRGLLGFGYTDYQLGGFYKWVPFPDTETQPAVGILAGVLVAKQDDVTEVSLRAHPMASKVFPSEVGRFNAYLALPLGIRNSNGGTDATMQMAIGTKFNNPEWNKYFWYVEAGINIVNASSYISFGLKTSLDDDLGFKGE